MPEWLIHLSGNESDLKELSKSLKSDELSIIKEDDGYYLKSVFLNQFDKASDVKNNAEDILQLINGSMYLVLSTRDRISTSGCLIKTNEDNTKMKIVSIQDTIGVRRHIGLTIQRSDGSIEEINQTDPIPAWLALASRNENITKVLRLLGKGEYNWVNLYRIFEVIANDVGSESNIVSNSWTTRNQIVRFKRTANSADAIGDESRHGVEETEPPPDPMQYSEAEAFIKTLVHNWLRTKVEGL